LKTTQRYSSFFAVSIFVLLIQSCSVSKKIQKQAHTILLQDSVINTGHIGISIFEPATNSYWYNYNAEKYFVPASNTKLFTLYAGMKYLGDSLVGLRYSSSDLSNADYETQIKPTGDPTFLHPDFLNQPIFDFLKERRKVFFWPGNLYYGKGWAWDDYQEAFMPSRSDFPMYGNLMNVKWLNKDSISISPKFFGPIAKKYGSWIDGFSAGRNPESNGLLILEGKNKIKEIPFSPDFITVTGLLEDTLPNLSILGAAHYPYSKNENYETIHSQPTDSLLTPMMHNSDNFFAEQTLLMASNEYLGHMDDEAIIDTLLKADLKDVPQKPKWVDGSGLSRYNLFTPQSFVYILNKMKNEFGWERLKTILPTGGEGTLKNYYNSDSSFIYAKTGSLSNQITLSGFLITKKNKLLVFSMLTNNAIGDGWRVRRAYESFLKGIREQY